LRESGFGGIAVAATVVVFFALMPFLLVIAVYTLLTVYGMTKGTTFDSSSVNAGVVFAGLAAITALLVCLLGLVVWGIDRALGRGRSGREAGDPT
jgi:hypothetical protein